MKTMRNAGIVLLVVVLVFLAGGVGGVLINAERARSAASPHAAYTETMERITAESTYYLQYAVHARENIAGYERQTALAVQAIADAGVDTAEVAALSEQITALKMKADEQFAAMEKQHGFITEMLIMPEDTLSADLDSNLSKAQKRLNAVLRALKSITKTEATEATRSLETQARILCEQSAALVTAAGASPPEPFVVEPFEARAADEQADEGDKLAHFLAENFDYLFWLAGLVLIIAVLCLIGWKNRPMLTRIGDTAQKKMMLIALVAIVLLFFVITDYSILSPANVSNIINQNAYIVILATGMLLCIVSSGNIDLSVGRLMGFIGACAAKFMIEGKMNPYLAIVACLLIGVAVGAWQGFWIAYVRIPAFIVTLAGQLVFYGLTMVILQGLTISNFPPVFQTIFCSYLADPFGGQLFGVSLRMNVLSMLVGVVVVAVFVFMQIRARAQRMRKGYTLEPLRNMIVRVTVTGAAVLWLFYSLAKAQGVPSVLFTLGIVLLIYAYVTSKTVMGRHLYAMGGNVNAARLSGVKTQKMLFLVYVNMGLLGALAGLVYAARLNSSSPQAGSGDELYAIASCYIGGASAYGGIGTVGGALIGALTMGVLKNGMSIEGMGQDIQQVVMGLVLLTAVVFDVVTKQKIKLPGLSRVLHRITKPGKGGTL